MSLGLSNVVEQYGQRYQGVRTQKNTASETGFATYVNCGGKAKKESVVDEYKKKKPESAAHVDSQVRAGKAVISRNGADNVSREDMTMEEYKSFFMKLMDSIPFDATRLRDKEIVNISEEAWEQMKNDPDYEAWVLGYTVENRSVRNPFAALGGGGMLCIERFGASIEEHLGQGVSMDADKHSKKSTGEKSWWEERHEKMEELLEEALQKAEQRKALVKISQAKAAQEENGWEENGAWKGTAQLYSAAFTAYNK